MLTAVMMMIMMKTVMLITRVVVTRTMVTMVILRIVVAQAIMIMMVMLSNPCYRSTVAIILPRDCSGHCTNTSALDYLSGILAMEESEYAGYVQINQDASVLNDGEADRSRRPFLD